MALGTAFAVGAALGGLGGGTLALTLGILIVGPAYLIQQRIRRRRGVEPRGRILDRDAGEVMAAVLGRYVLAYRRRPGMRLLMTVVMVGELAILWVALGERWAIAGLVALGLGISAAYARRLKR